MLRKLILKSIRLYRLTLSNLWWHSCRFYPTCSQYALDAIESYGIWKGGWMSCKRLGRCHPWCDGGHDPVPPVNSLIKVEADD